MKSLAFVACLFVLSAVASPPETMAGTAAEDALSRGRIEVGLAISFSRASESGDDDSITLVNVPFRVGWMVTDRLELEGELLMSYLDFGDDDGGAGAIGAGHLLYHFPLSGNAALFVLGGAGYGNAIEFVRLAAKQDENVAVYRVGAGLKAFFGPNAALRAEYRFTRYHGGEPEFRDPTRLNDHKVLVGVSLWLH